MYHCILPLPLLSPLGYTCFDFEHALGSGRLEIGLKSVAHWLERTACPWMEEVVEVAIVEH
ncbi:hypothetical protein RMATCC62417_13536 [Rhizopus microsporus]|nr:hypothetical protein RMATCC62417_13536 [Rhizopus microsporus]